MGDFLKNIVIREEFDDGQGRFLHYDAYDVSQRAAIVNQKHVNIRTFTNDPITKNTEMGDLSLFTMGDLSTLTMDDLDGQTTVVRRGEEWTQGTVGLQADRNNWRGISLSCTAGGTTSTESVLGS